MYVMFDPARPHIVLGTSESLEGIAAALAARPEPGLKGPGFLGLFVMGPPGLEPGTYRL